MADQRHQQRPDVVIVGGGIVGCALAYDLTGRGISVELIERRELAREASWASAGIISPPTPALGNRREIGLRAYREYPSLVAEVEELTGISTGFNVSGELMAVLDDEVEHFRVIEEWQRQHGIRTEWLEGQSLREHEPALHGRYVAGLRTPDTASIRLERFAGALARAAALRGARLREFTTVTGIIREGGRATGVQTIAGAIQAGTVVVAAGAWSGPLVESLDVSVPTYPVLGQMLAVADPPVRIRNVIAGGGGYVVPREDGTVAVGATEEHESGYGARVTPAGLAWLAGLIDRVAPSLNHGTLHSTWAGLRPGSGDGELVVGRLPHIDNVWIAAGHFRGGAVLGPVTAQLLAESIASGVDSDELAAFSPARFA